MGVLGESAVVLIPAVNKPFGSVTVGTVAQKIKPLKGFGVSPPERIGVGGEYDYNGLAKRVAHCFAQSVSEDISQLVVRQRGCVVILTGSVSTRALLNRLVTYATKVEGTALVEIYRVRFTEEVEEEEGVAA